VGSGVQTLRLRVVAAGRALRARHQARLDRVVVLEVTLAEPGRAEDAVPAVACARRPEPQRTDRGLRVGDAAEDVDAVLDGPTDRASGRGDDRAG